MVSFLQGEDLLNKNCMCFCPKCWRILHWNTVVTLTWNSKCWWFQTGQRPSHSKTGTLHDKGHKQFICIINIYSVQKLDPFDFNTRKIHVSEKLKGHGYSKIKVHFYLFEYCECTSMNYGINSRKYELHVLVHTMCIGNKWLGTFFVW